MPRRSAFVVRSVAEVSSVNWWRLVVARLEFNIAQLGVFGTYVSTMCILINLLKLWGLQSVFVRGCSGLLRNCRAVAWSQESAARRRPARLSRAAAIVYLF